jgi:hypothetical protein
MKNTDVEIFVEYEEWVSDKYDNFDWVSTDRTFNDLVLFFLWAANSEQTIRNIRINGEYAYEYDTMDPDSK